MAIDQLAIGRVLDAAAEELREMSNSIVELALELADRIEERGGDARDRDAITRTFDRLERLGDIIGSLGAAAEPRKVVSVVSEAEMHRRYLRGQLR